MRLLPLSPCVCVLHVLVLLCTLGSKNAQGSSEHHVLQDAVQHEALVEPVAVHHPVRHLQNQAFTTRITEIDENRSKNVAMLPQRQSWGLPGAWEGRAPRC